MRALTQPSASVREEVVRTYYETTAERGHVPSIEHYDRAAAGLKLRLKPWLPQDLGARCVDLASGCGELIYLLEREGFRDIRGVDLCAVELEHARSYVKADLITADVLEYLRRCESQSVDFITDLNFLA